MPFAKVGALPQPNEKQKRNGQRAICKTKAAKPKGITMEDLKKQTALRLAQEQQQKQQTPLPSDTPRAHILPSQPAPQLSAFGYPHYSQTSANVEPYAYHGNSNYNPASRKHTSYQPEYNTVQLGRPRNEQHENDPFVGSGSQPSNPSLDAISQQQRPRNDVAYQRHYTVVEHAASNIHLASDRNLHPTANNGQQKLPHAITVSELKEMTKARLQAEQLNGREPGVTARALSPHMSGETRDLYPRDSMRTSAPSGSESMNSIPSLAQTSTGIREMNVHRSTQASPLPPGFQTVGAIGSPAGLYGSGRGESWENASVASFNSNTLSDNLGAESGHQLGMGGSILPGVDADVAYGRARSFSAHQSRGLEEGSLTAVSPGRGTGLFDLVVGTGNRRRAATLSPRSVPIHEERSAFHVDSLDLPNISRSSGVKLLSRPSRNSYSPVLDIALENHVLGNDQQGNPNDFDLNRPRTSSATSLPPAMEGLNDFNRHRANTFNGFSTNATGNPLMGVSGALTSSFLHNSGESFGSAMNPYAEGSRNDSAPPGFSHSQKGHQQGIGSFSAFSQEFDTHFVDSSGNGTGSQGGATMFQSDKMDALTDSMGSILKLSGNGIDRPDRERSNTYPYAAFEK